MFAKSACWVLVCLTAGLLLTGEANAQLRVTLPRRSKPTPVQKLNREGVKAIQHHDYEKAKKLFYNAYLIDPNDPFTLNNLGYISELEGKVDRAERFYALAAANRSDATVELSNDVGIVGKPVLDVAGNAGDRQMQINRFNVQAIDLLLKDRAPEADLVLQKALALDANNPFTLNNLGFAREKEGEYDQALGLYTRAAQQRSKQTVMVTLNRDWRGKPISQIAGRNANTLRKLMAREETPAAQVARLNLRGVSALNRNDPQTARQDFQQAYKLDPNNAFTLNNLGYIAELDGDRETADFYYAKAQEADKSNRRVDVATRADVQGQLLQRVANGSDQAVQQRIETALAARRRQGGPVRLMHRDNTPVIEPDKPVTPPPSPIQSRQAPPLPQNQLLMPLPANQQPPDAYPGPTPNVGPNPPPQAPAQNTQPQGGLMMPLPENQQPPNADKETVPPAQKAIPTKQQASPQKPQPPPQNSQSQGGLMMPLPDNQQPPNADKGPAPAQTTPQQKPQNPPQQ